MEDADDHEGIGMHVVKKLVCTDKKVEVFSAAKFIEIFLAEKAVCLFLVALRFFQAIPEISAQLAVRYSQFTRPGIPLR